MVASLYIHIPFCTQICDYCDFFSVPVNAGRNKELPDMYIDAVLDDIADQFSLFDIELVPTVYVGGGTPSALGAVRMERLLAGLQTLLSPLGIAGTAGVREFTVEANPESADESFMQTCADGGVNRISLGVQTFHEPSRRAVHRAGNSSLLNERLTLAAEYFPSSFSVDMISGLPFQTAGVLAEDMRRALSFQPGHISLYSLTLDPETPLGKQAATRGEAALSLSCGDDADNLWLAGRDMLEQSGLTQYEVSNFTAPDQTCTHNIRYWRMENWLGAGPAASGTVIDEEAGTGRRFTYPADISRYLAAPRPRIRSARVEELRRDDLMRESLLMGFRYRQGPDPVLFKQRFGCSIADCIPRTINRWRKRGLLDEPGTALSSDGLLFLNGFLRDAFAELG